MSLQAAAAAAADRSAGTTRDDAIVARALHGEIAHRSQRAHLDSALLHRSGNNTCLQVDTDMKTGMHGLTPLPTTVPADQHITGATDATEASPAHGTRNTSLQGASEIPVGRENPPPIRTARVAPSPHGSPGTSHTRRRTLLAHP